MDIRLRIILSVVVGITPFIHAILTHEPTYIIISTLLGIVHYVWVMDVDEFLTPLDPFYILLDTILLNGIIYGLLVGFSLLFR